MFAAPRSRSLALSTALSSVMLVACGGGGSGQTDSASSSSGTSSSSEVATQGPTTTPTSPTTGGPVTGTESSSTTQEPGTSSSTTLTTSSGSSGTTAETDSTSSSGTGSSTGDTDTGGALCCMVGDAPGCGDATIEACVCAKHPGCCTEAWTQACVAAVDIDGCGDCGGPPPVGACCEAGLGPGCDDPLVQLCVCEQKPECCTELWTAECAAAVESELCGSCSGGFELCCAAHDTPGCPSPDIQTCVCGGDPFCCEEFWDDICVSKVDSLGCGMCPVQPGPCCESSSAAGCEDPDIVACVCDKVPGCCDDAWGPECVAAVETLGCGMCPSNCCSVQDTPGCEDMAIEECVCALDSFCCTEFWDDTCVFEVEADACGSCQ